MYNYNNKEQTKFEKIMSIFVLFLSLFLFIIFYYYNNIKDKGIEEVCFNTGILQSIKYDAKSNMQILLFVDVKLENCEEDNFKFRKEIFYLNKKEIIKFKNIIKNKKYNFSYKRNGYSFTKDTKELLTIN